MIIEQGFLFTNNDDNASTSSSDNSNQGSSDALEINSSASSTTTNSTTSDVPLAHPTKIAKLSFQPTNTAMPSQNLSLPGNSSSSSSMATYDLLENHDNQEEKVEASDLFSGLLDIDSMVTTFFGDGVEITFIKKQSSSTTFSYLTASGSTAEHWYGESADGNGFIDLTVITDSEGHTRVIG